MSAARCLRTAAAAAVAAAVLALGGCSTAGSMLVEVDVYKGPLSKTKTVQFGELIAVFGEAEALLGIFETSAKQVAEECRKVGPQPDCQQLYQALFRAQALIRELKLYLAPDRPDKLGKLMQAAATIEALLDAGKKPAIEAKTELELINDATLQATTVATQLKVEAFYWAESQIGGLPANSAARSILVGFTNLLSELSNQISSRTDTLAKQLGDGIGGSTLSLSDHLKDAGPTDFLHLYDWYDATLPDSLSRWPNRLSAQDRARLARRLFSDHYWTRINQVHASGQGEVRMALVKDDIGNWNLKSFDNDPEKLLSAYRDLTYAGIATAIRIGKDVSSGGGAAGLEIASQLARGRFGSSQTAALGSSRIDAMRNRAVADLQALEAQAAAPAAVDLKNTEATARREFDDAQARAGAARKSYLDIVGQREAQQRNIDQAIQAELPTEQMDKGLQILRRDEDNKRIEAVRLREDAEAARIKLDTAQAKHRDYMAALVAEAKKAIEIHRRVIDGLKELQTAPATPAAAGLPATADGNRSATDAATAALRRAAGR